MKNIILFSLLSLVVFSCKNPESLTNITADRQPANDFVAPIVKTLEELKQKITLNGNEKKLVVCSTHTHYISCNGMNIASVHSHDFCGNFLKVNELQMPREQCDINTLIAHIFISEGYVLNGHFWIHYPKKSQIDERK